MVNELKIKSKKIKIKSKMKQEKEISKVVKLISESVKSESLIKRDNLLKELFEEIINKKIVNSDICKYAGISESQFYNFFKGRTDPQLTTVLKIILAVRELGGDVSFFI